MKEKGLFITVPNDEHGRAPRGCGDEAAGANMTINLSHGLFVPASISYSSSLSLSSSYSSGASPPSSPASPSLSPSPSSFESSSHISPHDLSSFFCSTLSPSLSRSWMNEDNINVVARRRSVQEGIYGV